MKGSRINSVSIAASFRVMKRGLRPDEVSELLGLHPTTWQARDGGADDGLTKRFQETSESVWSLRSELPESADLKDHLLALSDKLLPAAVQIKELRESGYRVDILVAVFDIESNAGFVLSSRTLSALAQLGVSLEFDLYS